MIMKKKWQDFERIIAAIHAETNGAAAVTWDDEINGRQFDVVVRFKQGLHDYLTVIECKDYAGRVTVDKVDAFATKTRDINANKSVMVAANGFQSGCLEVARRHGITLLTLHESVDTNAEPEGGGVTPALNVFRVRLVKESGEEFEFEEWNGKLEYLMNHCRLLSDGATSTPSQVIDQWRRSELPELTQTEARFEIPLPAGTIAEMPFEDAFNATAIRLHCKVVTASIGHGNVATRHIRELAVLQHELQDCITGGTVYKGKQFGLNLGFDVEIAAGKFYSGLGGTANYYCLERTADLITLLMLESYQHGSLIQAKFTVKPENAKSYVEVKDKSTLSRLQRMLADFDRTTDSLAQDSRLSPG
jgi:hypothetical protein